MRIKEGNKEQDIIAAAIVVFGNEGYAKAKMHHIADGSGVGIGTVYLYFPNKEKILLRIFENVWKALHGKIAAVRRRADLDAVHKMYAVIDAVFDYFAAAPLLALVFVNEQQQIIRANRSAPFLEWYDKTLEESEALIVEGQRNGCFNPEVNSKFFRHFLFGGMRHILLQWASDPKAFPLATLRRNMKTVMFSGIAPQR